MQLFSQQEANNCSRQRVVACLEELQRKLSRMQIFLEASKQAISLALAAQEGHCKSFLQPRTLTNVREVAAIKTHKEVSNDRPSTLPNELKNPYSRLSSVPTPQSNKPYQEFESISASFGQQQGLMTSMKAFRKRLR